MATAATEARSGIFKEKNKKSKKGEGIPFRVAWSHETAVRRERLWSSCTKPECAGVGGFIWRSKQGSVKVWGLSRNTGVGTLSQRHWIKGFLTRVFSEGVFITVSERMLLIRTIWSRQVYFILQGFSFFLSFPSLFSLPSMYIMCYRRAWWFEISEDRLHYKSWGYDTCRLNYETCK